MKRLWRDRGGAALVEFALVLPVMLLMGMGLCEMAYQAYMQAILTGAVQKAGRDSTVESANTTTIDNAVLQAVKNINGNAAFVSGYPMRKSYASYGYISPESFVDSNGNGMRDPGECFTDVNGNGIWDADPGVSGNGGAGYTVLYLDHLHPPVSAGPVAGLGQNGHAFGQHDPEKPAMGDADHHGGGHGMHMITMMRRLLRDGSGASLIEFALALPVVF
ncbi:TadE/TadG family type IV pilus assembly protein [Novosphingobium sp. SCN 63-17]|uniref:TadE/TadG family type IV pilus assembly protein n=1 Tax=Novosphingobium sp. SCN 63-17 TaxID=1660120 RepID=UPI000AD58FFA|nr:TadE/TadG family type IV pilus assembly protein [Novosphingobium sp. SCN 63-17]